MTSTRTGSPASPSSSAPQGAPLHHPSRCTAPRPARATKIRGRLSRLPLKKAPWPQGAWPLGGIRSVRRQRSKSGAAKRFLTPKKLPKCSLLWPVATTLLFQHAKTPRYSQLQRMGTRMTKLFITKGLPWP